MTRVILLFVLSILIQLSLFSLRSLAFEAKDELALSAAAVAAAAAASAAGDAAAATPGAVAAEEVAAVEDAAFVEVAATVEAAPTVEDRESGAVDAVSGCDGTPGTKCSCGSDSCGVSGVFGSGFGGS